MPHCLRRDREARERKFPNRRPDHNHRVFARWQVFGGGQRDLTVSARDIIRRANGACFEKVLTLADPLESSVLSLAFAPDSSKLIWGESSGFVRSGI